MIWEHKQNDSLRGAAAMWRACRCWLVLLIACTMPAIAQQTVTVPVQQTRQEQTSISPVLALPAKAIMQLIDRQPEVAVELKRLLASRLRSGGSAIEDDGISDEALLRILVEDVRFRAACTLLLRTRGYVSDADMEQEEMETTARRGDPLNPDNDPSALYSSAQTDRGQNSLRIASPALEFFKVET